MNNIAYENVEMYLILSWITLIKKKKNLDLFLDAYLHFAEINYSDLKLRILDTTYEYLCGYENW